MRAIFPGLIFFRVMKDENGEDILKYSQTLGLDLPKLEIWTCRAIKNNPPTGNDPVAMVPGGDLEYFLVGPEHVEGGLVVKMSREEIGTIIYLGVDFLCMENTFELGPIAQQHNVLLEKARKDLKRILPDHDFFDSDGYVSDVRPTSTD